MKNIRKEVVTATIAVLGTGALLLALSLFRSVESAPDATVKWTHYHFQDDTFETLVSVSASDPEVANEFRATFAIELAVAGENASVDLDRIERGEPVALKTAIQRQAFVEMVRSMREAGFEVEFQRLWVEN